MGEKRAVPKAEFRSFDLARLVEKAESQQSPYLEFLRVPALSCGLYHLSVGATDTQTSHDEDEVYFVLKGSARLIVQGTEHKLGPGSILYVPADTDHEFVDIAEELSLLVFFGSGGPSGAQF